MENAREPAKIDVEEDIQVREAKALRLILQGVKKCKAIPLCNLPYATGDRNYRRITRMAGKKIDLFGH